MYTMDIIVQLNNQTAGRDKIIRLLQYCARAGWYYSQSSRPARQPSDVLKSLEYTFSSFRKLLRFGRCLDSLYAASKLLEYPDLMVRITMTISKVTNALFLLADHMIWMGRAGVMRVNLDKWTQQSNRYWLITIVMNLTRDLYEIIRALEQRNVRRVTKLRNYSKNVVMDKCRALLSLTDRTDIVLDTVKNGCDLFIPLSALGYTKLSPGTVGLLGSISSAVGLYCLVHPLFKLPAT